MGLMCEKKFVKLNFSPHVLQILHCMFASFLGQERKEGLVVVDCCFDLAVRQMLVR